MPEGPHVMRTVLWLEQRLKVDGGHVKDILAGQDAWALSRLVNHDDATPLTFEKAHVHGKQLWLVFLYNNEKHIVLTCHHGLNGYWGIQGNNVMADSDYASIPHTSPNMLTIVMENGSCIAFCGSTVQGARLCWDWLENITYPTFPSWLTLSDDGDVVCGVEDMQDCFMGAKNKQIGLALVDQHIAAGIGNKIRSEVLFLAHVHPKTKCCNLTSKDWQALYEAVRKVAFGMFYDTYTCVIYGRKKTVDENAVEIVAQSGRKVYIDPLCQMIK